MAYMKKMEVELAMHRAMRISEPVEPDLPPPGGWPAEPTKGWMPIFYQGSFRGHVDAGKPPRPACHTGLGITLGVIAMVAGRSEG